MNFIPCTCKYIGAPKPEVYFAPEALSLKTVRFANSWTKISIWGQGPDSEAFKRLERDIERYNEEVEFIDSLATFDEVFSQRLGYMEKDEFEYFWGEEDAEKVMSFGDYPFETAFRVRNGCFFAAEMVFDYKVCLNGTWVKFTLGPTDDGYPKESAGGTRFYLWNWHDEKLDLCYALWSVMDRFGLLPPVTDEDAPVKDYYRFECYGQAREDMTEPDVNLWKCLKMLEDANYLKLYDVTESPNPTPWWYYRGNSNGHIQVGVLDKRFLSNPMMVRKLKVVLAASEEDIRTKPYVLTDGRGQPYLSDRAGALGGHSKLHIYGCLDCPSAKRYLEKGQYAQYRVFFANEADAIAADYRPCGVCMRDAYMKWKANQKKEV